MNEIHDEEYFIEKIGYEWLIYKKLSIKKSSYVKYENLFLSHILPYYKDYKLKEIDDISISMFLNWKMEKLSLSTIKTLYYIIQAILNYGNKKYNIAINNYKIHLPKNNRKTKILTQEEQLLIEKEAMLKNKEVSHAVFLGLYAGLRIGEICALKWTDVDFDNRLLYVHHTVQRLKNESGIPKTVLITGSTKSFESTRYVPISKPLANYLLKIKSNCTNQLVISNSDCIDPRKIQYQFGKLLQACNLQNVHFHMLRHTFATNCIKKGIDIKSLSEILGHSNVNITLDLYVHSSIEFKKQQMDKWDKFEIEKIS